MYKHRCMFASLIFVILCFMPMCEGPVGPVGPEGPTVSQLDAPILLSPGNLATFNIYPRTTTLYWSSVVSAVQYNLQVDYGWDCSATDACLSWSRPDQYIDINVQGTTYTFNFVGAQPGRWRVRALDSRNNPGRWSEYRYFRYLR